MSVECVSNGLNQIPQLVKNKMRMQAAKARIRILKTPHQTLLPHPRPPQNPAPPPQSVDIVIITKTYHGLCSVCVLPVSSGKGTIFIVLHQCTPRIL